MSSVAETRHCILQYLPDEPAVGDSLGLYGEFLQAQLDVLLSNVTAGSVVLEANAGIGAHAIPIAQALGPQGHLMIYEPDPLRQRILRQNLSANRLQNSTVMRRSLGPLTDDLDPVKSNGPDGAGPDSPPRFESIDQLRLDRLDLIKLSANADPLELIRGAAQTLWGQRPLLFVDVPDHEVMGRVATLVADFGYRRWRLDTPLFNPDNFNRRRDNLLGNETRLALLAVPEERAYCASLTGCAELR